MLITVFKNPNAPHTLIPDLPFQALSLKLRVLELFSTRIRALRRGLIPNPSSRPCHSSSHESSPNPQNQHINPRANSGKTNFRLHHILVPQHAGKEHEANRSRLEASRRQCAKEQARTAQCPQFLRNDGRFLTWEGGCWSCSHEALQ